jgi:hypothetical protein
MAFVRWRIRITQLYLAETEIRRAAVEELFSDVARHPMKAIWIAALCVLSANANCRSDNDWPGRLPNQRDSKFVADRRTFKNSADFP